MAELLIVHTHEDGTQVDGSTRGDGVYEILTALPGRGWTFRSWAGVHIRGSRDTFARRAELERDAEALRAAGHTVTIEIDNTWRPAAVRWAEREERAEDRAERYAGRAGRQAAEADRRWEAEHDILRRFEGGQPILMGHHSQRKAENDRDRAESHRRKASAAADYARHLAERARGAVANEVAKHGSRAMMRKVERLSEDVRRYERQLADDDGMPATPGMGEWREIAVARLAMTVEERDWLAGILAERAEVGEFVTWGPEHFAKGDEVKTSFGWLPVRRVNRKSVSVPWIILWLDGRDEGHTDTVAWDRVFGRRRNGMQLDTPNGQEFPVGGQPTPAEAVPFALDDDGPMTEDARCGWASRAAGCDDERRWEIGYRAPDADPTAWTWRYVCGAHRAAAADAGRAAGYTVKTPEQITEHHPAARRVWELSDADRFDEALAVLATLAADPPYATEIRTARRSWADMAGAVRDRKAAAARRRPVVDVDERGGALVLDLGV